MTDRSKPKNMHAPKRTVIRGRVRDGKITDLKVTPEARRKDVAAVHSG
jgi:hypothetical protein